MDHHRGLLFSQDKYFQIVSTMNKRGLWYNRIHVPRRRIGY